ncbi:hypothetical protein PS862_02866 [Pseudomonas fluorescens]|uniref:Uncharacterized protein n=1 Tax=Pseudomonas fluorescens TaxID=294 RepID=A0A5E7KNX4_PSEFL|nr:hypothetical protein [Pseudomonas fluorescens]VVP01397.1 hypothetical protein PS862_02866 [Pseudomonas fluorescens]
MGLVQKQFGELITFMRGSSGGRYNANGVFELVPLDQPRFDYDPVTKLIKGLLIEESRTNLQVASSQFHTWTLFGDAKVYPSTTVSPDGTLTAAMVENTPNSNSQISRNPILADGTYTRTIYLKSNGVDPFTVVFEGVGGGGSGGSQTFDVLGKAFVGGLGAAISRSFTEVGNGWIRVSVVGVQLSGVSTVGGKFYIGAYGNTPIQHRGYMWGAQIEAGSFETSHNPTPSTFAGRASAARLFDSNGVLQTAAINTARNNAYGYDSAGVLRPIGLLVEGAATNLLLQSSAYVGAPWQRRGSCTVTSGVGPTAPDGSAAGQYLQGVSNSGNDLFQPNVPVGVATRCEPSIFIAKGTTTGVLVLGNAMGVGLGQWRVDLAKLSTSYQRITRNHPSVTIVTEFVGDGSGNSGIHLYRFSGDATLDFYAWGGQLEVGYDSTSYIPTTTAQVTRAADVTSSVQVTRAADVASVNTLSPWFNASEGTLFVEWATSHDRAESGIVAITNESANNAVFTRQIGGRVARSTVTSDGQVQAVGSGLGTAPGTVTKGAFGFAANSFVWAEQGSVRWTDTSGVLPVNMTKLLLGAAFSGTTQLNGHIRSIRYYPRRLTDAELQVLTA